MLLRSLFPAATPLRAYFGNFSDFVPNVEIQFPNLADLNRLAKRLIPIPMTNNPESRLIHGNNFSGTMNWAAKSVINPNANTPRVWVMVVVRPRYIACFMVPREPTRYAPTIVLP